MVKVEPDLLEDEKSIVYQIGQEDRGREKQNENERERERE